MLDLVQRDLCKELYAKVSLHMADGKPFEEPSIGAESLKAFAHPLRMAMYEELTRLGAATASQLARTLGERDVYKRQASGRRTESGTHR